MRYHGTRTQRRLHRLELLEGRLCLSVSASVSDGNLIVKGDADGPVVITATAAGAFTVTDNGVTIADATTLTGVTGNIRINLEQTTKGTDDTVTVDLGSQTVDAVYANLGSGTNSFELTGGTASKLYYRGGSGNDTVQIDSTVTGGAYVELGGGDNGLTVNSEVGRLGRERRQRRRHRFARYRQASSTTASMLDSAAVTTPSPRPARSTAILRSRHVTAPIPSILPPGSTVAESVRLDLGSGANTATIAGSIGEKLIYNGRDGDDNVTIADTATVGTQCLRETRRRQQYVDAERQHHRRFYRRQQDCGRY